MMGNDVVDRATARLETNWQRPGFLTKAFTKPEQALITAATDPDVWVWTVWSQKESAYKLAARLGFQGAFVPAYWHTHVQAATHNEVWGQVQGAGYGCQTYSHITADVIATVAYPIGQTPTPVQHVVRFTKPDYHTQQQQLRQAVLADFQSVGVWVSIQKNANGVPSLYVSERGQTTMYALSLSHHGRFGAYCVGGVWQE